MVVLPSAAANSLARSTPSECYSGLKWRITLHPFGEPDLPDAVNTTRVTTVNLFFSTGLEVDLHDPSYLSEMTTPNVPPNGGGESTSGGSRFAGLASRDARVSYTPAAVSSKIASAVSAFGPTHLDISVTIGTSVSSGPSTGGTCAIPVLWVVYRRRSIVRRLINTLVNWLFVSGWDGAL